MHQDGISEAVSHFIGLFSTFDEAARLRHGYDQFHRPQQAPSEDPLAGPHHAAPRQPLELGPNNPIIKYAPEQAENHIPAEIAPIDIAAIFARMPEAATGPLQPMAPPSSWMAPDPGPTTPLGPLPGSLGLVVNQVAHMLDDDVVVIGAVEGPLPTYRPDTSAVDSMLAEIGVFSEPFAGLPPGDIFNSIPQFIAGAADAAYAMASLTPAGTSVHSATGDAVMGVHVNGRPADGMPSLDEAMPFEDDEAPEPLETGSVSLQAGDNSMDVVTGQNLLGNEAHVVDAGLAPMIVAIAGDHVRLDVISQANAYADDDRIDPGFAGTSEGGATQSFNIASFSETTMGAQAAAVAANPDAMPANWTVSIYEGDLVFLEWITQYAFASDNDLLVLTATGSTTNIDTGGNSSLNGVTFADIGLYYDVIIIGGSLYDANIICQTNVLYDNDTLQMLSGAHADGSLSSSDNLLWNQASISRFGPSDATGPLPEHYTDAMHSLDRGNLTMPSGFGDDPALAGIENLRVLYVTGDVYDLRLVQQTNVLGDADHVAVYAKGLLEHPGSEWTVSTGQNALTNVASIADYASTGETLYVGGQTYSDAVLIQAELVDNSSPDNGGLANELIAFLDSEPALQVAVDHYPTAPSNAEAAPADVMQSVLA